jgi:hypothetical protein
VRNTERKKNRFMQRGKQRKERNILSNNKKKNINTKTLTVRGKQTGKTHTNLKGNTDRNILIIK